MIGTTAAILGAAAIGGAASIFGASKAADAQTAATDKATDAQLKMFGITRDALQPFVDSGAGSAGTLNKLLTPDGGVDASIFEKLPGYKFALDQGLKASTNAVSARGLNDSGAAIKGATNWATGLANQTFGDQVNRLLENSRIGANAAAGIGQNATATGQSVGSNAIGAGNAQAAAWNTAGNAVGNVASSVPQSMYFNKLLGSAAPAAAAPTWVNGVGYTGLT